MFMIYSILRYVDKIKEMLNIKPTVILRVAAVAEKLVNILLGHGKSGGCDFCTLRFGDVCNLLGFRGEEGKLFSLDGRFICQA